MVKALPETAMPNGPLSLKVKFILSSREEYPRRVAPVIELEHNQMVVLEKSEAGSRCIINGIFAEGERSLTWVAPRTRQQQRSSLMG